MFWGCTEERWTATIKTRRGNRSVRYRERTAWPDGEGMMAQETCLVDLFEIMLSKCNEDLTRG